MSLDRWCACGRPADGHGTCHDCDADRRAEDEPTKQALGERLSSGGLDVPRGFE